MAICWPWATRGASSTAPSRIQPNFTMSLRADGIRGNCNRGFRANQPSAPEWYAEADCQVDVVLGLLVGLERRLIDPGAVDVVIGGYIEAEHAPEPEAQRGAGHPADVVLVFGILVRVAAPTDV